jgi:hypothetical protein
MLGCDVRLTVQSVANVVVECEEERRSKKGLIRKKGQATRTNRGVTSALQHGGVRRQVDRAILIQSRPLHLPRLTSIRKAEYHYRDTFHLRT